MSDVFKWYTKLKMKKKKKKLTKVAYKNYNKKVYNKIQTIMTPHSNCFVMLNFALIYYILLSS